MDNQTVNTYYVALQPPYKIIKHGNKIGVQIGTQRVVVAGGNPFRTETHDYPVVAAENRIAALKDNDYRLDGSSDGEIWDNVETKNVSVLCDAGVCLEWEQFIEILWHDHARLGNPRQQINKVYLFNKIVSYNKHMMLPPPDLYTLHLHTLISEEGFPYVVRTKKEDVFALNVEWSDNLIELENRLVSDLKSYLLILSPNRRTNFWQMHYETEEDRLRPLMERLNANPKAISFRNQIMASFTVKAIPPYEKKESQNTNMAESVIDKISANNIRYYYEGWRNGKHGSICQTMGIYRFVEMAYVKSGILDDVNKNEEDNPIVAKGIVAYWLQFNSRMDTVIKRLTKYNCEIPKDIREQFDNYTQIRFEQFRREHRDDPETWDWDWDREFYANAIIPHEIAFNKQSEALFDYISDSDIALVRSVMNSYIKYLKKIRTEKGYLVNPELLVLRAIESGDETKHEDLEEFEVNTILDELESNGYIKVAWITGHRPFRINLLDKGRRYLKQLEKARVVVKKTAPVAESKPTVREITWEERKQCFKTAVLIVMEKKKADGNYLFENNSQWMAVYRFAIDLGIMYKADDPRKPKDTSTPQYAAFAKFAKELQLDENPPTRLPFTKNAIDSINSKPNYARFNTSHPWSHEGITDPRSLVLFIELDNVYLALEEEYDNLISQIERGVG